MSHLMKLQKTTCSWCVRRQIHVNSFLSRRKKPPERDMSKRNLQGEALALRLKKRQDDLERQQPYKEALSDVINRFTLELEEIEKEKHSSQGEAMKREHAEREQAVKNFAIIAKSNEELKKQRDLENLIKQDEIERAELDKRKKKIELREEQRLKNLELVLQTIEDSKDFVTEDNLEEKITELLNTETSFNYAITPDGEKIHSTRPPGNLDGWRGASPSAFIAGEIQPESSEWNFVFRNRTTGFEKRNSTLQQESTTN